MKIPLKNSGISFIVLTNVFWGALALSGCAPPMQEYSSVVGPFRAARTIRLIVSVNSDSLDIKQDVIQNIEDNVKHFSEEILHRMGFRVVDMYANENEYDFTVDILCNINQYWTRYLIRSGIYDPGRITTLPASWSISGSVMMVKGKPSHSQRGYYVSYTWGEKPLFESFMKGGVSRVDTQSPEFLRTIVWETVGTSLIRGCGKLGGLEKVLLLKESSDPELEKTAITVVESYQKDTADGGWDVLGTSRR